MASLINHYPSLGVAELREILTELKTSGLDLNQRTTVRQSALHRLLPNNPPERADFS